ncbi:hypothetical protein I5192_03175 [Ruegeria sp. SCSIO 43209]|uniref:hypothetical protein n=1 Tax=Ruegeria sp. SCSIO 43209 TaxID=2793010 RepID=UPI001CA9D1D6|nr:hypothetical protein [Ruegeria sp. SCSIO 43209]UAB89699.1 hypothetical protein I5192_03175 [Ruegeria sp. SCSIO 43209]
MLSPELSGILAASIQRANEEREVYRWLHSDRSKPLTPELKARLVKMAAEQFGDELAAKAMDEIATQHMPKVMQ